MALIDNIKAYYKMDESSGDMIDVVNGYNGTVSGATQNVSGKINTAYDFDGSNDYVDINNANLNISGDITLSVWYKNDAGSGARSLIVKNNTIYADIYVYLNVNGGTIGFYGSTDGSSWATAIEVSNSASTDTTSWHHLVITLSGTTATLYVDGTSIGTDSSADLGTASNHIYLGIDAGRSYFDGKVDEFGIWDRALSSTEVTTLYNSGSGLTYPFVTAPNFKINIGDSWKTVSAVKINIGDSWKDVSAAKINIGDSWKSV